jgi:hypothetical protein
MIPTEHRHRLEAFLREHGPEETCEDVCLVKDARAWLQRLLASEKLEHELLLLSMAYLVNQENLARAEDDTEKYRAAIAAFVARNGGIIKVEMDEIRSLVGTMTSDVDEDGAAVTYRFIDESCLRS